MIDYLYGKRIGHELDNATSKRILYIVPTTKHCVVGGAETAMADMVAGMCEGGWEVTVWTGIRDNRYRHKDEIIEAPSEGLQARYLFIDNFVEYYGTVNQTADTLQFLKRDLREKKYDVIHVCSFGALHLLEHLAEELYSARTIFSYFETPHLDVDGCKHPEIPDNWSLLDWKAAMGIIERFADVVVPFSTTYEAWLRQKIPALATPIIRCSHLLAIDRMERLRKEAARSEPLVSGRYVFICSRIVPRKGITQFIDVVTSAMALPEANGIRFVISAANYGHDFHKEYSAKLKAEISRRNLSDSMQVWTMALTEDDVYNLYVNSEFVVVPSIFEGYGIVPIEASVCGKPTVSYQIPGLVETMCHSINGVSVSPFATNEMSTAIVQLWNDQERRALLGQRSVNWVHGYLENLAREDRYAKVVDSLMKGIEKGGHRPSETGGLEVASWI